jgi:7-cyano-7-deazaguanine synthase
MTKAEIVTRGAELAVDFGLTHTCYDPVTDEESVLACGRCDACTLRLAGFKEAESEDPLSYVVEESEGE